MADLISLTSKLLLLKLLRQWKAQMDAGGTQVTTGSVAGRVKVSEAKVILGHKL